MSINLWGTDRPGFSQSMQRINQSFDNQTLVLPVADKGNVIGLALKQKFNVSQLKDIGTWPKILTSSLMSVYPNHCMI